MALIRAARRPAIRCGRPSPASAAAPSRTGARAALPVFLLRAERLLRAAAGARASSAPRSARTNLWRCSARAPSSRMLLLHAGVRLRWSSRFPRESFMPVVYGFFILCLLVFVPAFRAQERSARARWHRVLRLGQRVQPVRGVGVLELHGRHLYDSAQSRRLFRYIALGGTLGAICRAVADRARWCSHRRSQLMLVSVGHAARRIACVHRRWAAGRGAARTATRRCAARRRSAALVGGPAPGRARALPAPDGDADVVRRGVGTHRSTTQQRRLHRQALSDDRESRTQFYASVDLVDQRCSRWHAGASCTRAAC